MLETGKLVPNANLTLIDGSTRALWDFRQKSHILVLVGDEAGVRGMAARLADPARRKALVWLNVEVVATARAPEPFSAGAYAIDRFGELLGTYPLDDSLPDRIEKDFLYYEACHC